MRNLIFAPFVFLAVNCLGAGATVSTTNGFAVNLTAKATTALGSAITVVGAIDFSTGNGGTILDFNGNWPDAVHGSLMIQSGALPHSSFVYSTDGGSLTNLKGGSLTTNGLSVAPVDGQALGWTNGLPVALTIPSVGGSIPSGLVTNNGTATITNIGFQIGAWWFRTNTAGTLIITNLAQPNATFTITSNALMTSSNLTVLGQLIFPGTNASITRPSTLAAVAGYGVDANGNVSTNVSLTTTNSTISSTNTIPVAYAGWDAASNSTYTVNGVAWTNIQHIVIKTNLTIGTSFTNNFGATVVVNGLNVISTEAAVVGQNSMLLSITGSGGFTNIVYDDLTAIGIATGNVTNSLMSFTIPTNGIVNFTDTSAGAGNSVKLGNGQITY